MIAILVTGSRRWEHKEAIHERLSLYKGKNILIVGDASGADRIAAKWAREHNWIVSVYIPNWPIGKKAGPLRNGKMVDALDTLLHAGMHCSVEAFPDRDSRGTRNCMALATRAGFHVHTTEEQD